MVEEPSPDTLAVRRERWAESARGAATYGEPTSGGLVEGNAWDSIGAYQCPPREERTKSAPKVVTPLKRPWTYLL